MTVRHQAFSGVRWNALSRGVTALGGLIQLYILVRYIDPGDFGLMAMVNVFLFFVFNFLDFGINNGIIHKEQISHEQLSTMYWFTVLLGLILAVFTFGASTLVAWFYEEMRLIALIKILSVIFVIGAFGNQFKTLLLKNLHFDALALVNMISFFIGFAITVGLAIQGRGVWSLAIGNIAKYLTESLMAVFFGWKLFRPAWIFRLGEIQFFIRFGLFQMGERTLNFFNQQIDVILIGKLLGPDILGFYDVIKRFLARPKEMINPIITSALFPIMARVQKDDQQLSAIYLKQLQYICALNFPIYLLLYFNAASFIQILLGETWLEYTLVFKLFTLIMMSYCTGNPVGTLILAKGRAALGFYWNMALFIMIPAVVYLGINWGLEGVAVGLLGMQLLLALPNYWLQVRPLAPIGIGEYFWKIGQPLLLSMISVGLCSWIFQMAMDPGIFRLTVIVLTAGCSYLLVNWFFNRSFIQDLKSTANL